MYELTKYEKSDLMSLLHHYLKDHKYKHKVSDEDLAKEMGIGIDEFNKMLIGMKEPYSPLIKAVEVMMTLASLKKQYDQNPGDLLDWFFKKNHEVQSKERELEDIYRKEGITAPQKMDIAVTERREAKKSLYKWEQKLLDSFELVGTPLRNKFLTFCEESRRRGGSELEKLLEMAMERKDTEGR